MKISKIKVISIILILLICISGCKKNDSGYINKIPENIENKASYEKIENKENNENKENKEKKGKKEEQKNSYIEASVSEKEQTTEKEDKKEEKVFVPEKKEELNKQIEPEKEEITKQASEEKKEAKPLPVNPEETVISDVEHSCIISVRCDTIFDNLNSLDPEKKELIPKDGIILSERKAVFYEGESVFNILFRELKKNKIHLEFMSTPVYNSVYIEGINNIYEFDCGELSGWMYKVNGWFPNYGCSRYQLKEGDTVELIYTCDLGRDIGGGYAAGKQKDE